MPSNENLAKTPILKVEQLFLPALTAFMGLPHAVGMGESLIRFAVVFFAEATCGLS